VEGGERGARRPRFEKCKRKGGGNSSSPIKRIFPSAMDDVKGHAEGKIKSGRWPFSSGTWGQTEGKEKSRHKNKQLRSG